MGSIRNKGSVAIMIIKIRAARMIDLLESRGIVGPQNGSKPREVLKKLQNDDE